MLEKVKEIAGLLRDLGVIIGVPAIVAVGLSLYDLQHKANEAQVKALEAQNSVLKETQFDRAVALIDAQKKAYELDRANTARELGQLEKKLDESSKQYSEDLKGLRQCMAKVLATFGSKMSDKQSGDLSKDQLFKLILDAANQIC
jgi:competence protein ComGC